MRWVWHVALVVGRCIQGFGGERERGNLEDPDPRVDRKIILRWIFRK
jgi:hypothetical protein